MASAEIVYYNSSSPPPDSLFYNWTVSSGANKTNVKPPHPVLHGRQSRKASPVLRTSTRSAAMSSPSTPPSSMRERHKDHIRKPSAPPHSGENTLFILTFDENGGFGDDHVTSSSRRRACPVTYLTYTETAPDGKAVTLDFTRVSVYECLLPGLSRRGLEAV